MSRIISRAEAWERAYEAFNQINFSAFDFNTIKQSLIDHVKLFYPEDFNDYIESSEFIALLELFAYVGELFSYRLDLNAHENFITQAQRKESILRLAKLISYTPTRNLPARGLVKITSITTTEQIFDSNGVNLANTRVNWNDQNNSNWKEQFFLIINRILRQEFGSISPTERVQIDDVLFELYQIENNPITNGVLPYNVSVSGTNLPMELVPVSLTETSPEERRPDNVSSFSILYGSDGLGDGSDTTGFFCFTKQGTLTKETTTFDGVTPNQTYEVEVDNINDTDVYLNNVDPVTGETIDDGSVSGAKSGEWVEVDLANAQNIIFNTNERRQKYEIETLEDDQVRIIFGDGEFSNIPSGTFDIWYRTSLNEDIVVPQNTVINRGASFTYTDDNGNVQTLSFTFSLIGSLQNASASEDIEHIRRVAPSVYYTQDRMVNNRDYNTFMLQDPTILKMRAVNRTFAGDSKYIYWHDPSETYEHVKLFGCDLAVYVEEGEQFVEVETGVLDDLIDFYIEPILATTDFFTILTTRGVENFQLRKTFTIAERAVLFNVLTDVVNSVAFPPIHIWFSPDTLSFEFVAVGAGTPAAPSITSTLGSPGVPFTNPIWTDNEGVIVVEFTAPDEWRVTWKTERIVAQSDQTRFWNTNDANRTIDYDTLNSVNDRIVVLRANVDETHQNILASDFTFNVLGQELTVEELRDIHRLSVLPQDVDSDNIADNMDLDVLLDGSLVFSQELGSPPREITLPFPVLYDDFTGSDPILTLVGNVTGVMTIDGDGSPAHFQLEDPEAPGTSIGSGEAGDVIRVLTSDTQVTLQNRDFVYFSREDSTSDWVLESLTTDIIEEWYAEVATAGTYPVNWDDTNSLYRRLRGRQDFNFAWFHSADRFRLIDPAQTNIIDTFIITRGYQVAFTNWLENVTSIEPDAPTSLDLRTTFSDLLDNKMISDTLILHSGKFKVLFGSKAIPELQAKLKVVRPTSTNTTGNATSLTDNQVKTAIVEVVRTFFDVNVWEFGETFYFTELATAIHNDLRSEISSVVLVPQSANHQFGDLFQVLAREDEIFQADIGVEDIDVVQSFTATALRFDI